MKVFISGESTSLVWFSEADFPKSGHFHSDFSRTAFIWHAYIHTSGNTPSDAWWKCLKEWPVEFRNSRKLMTSSLSVHWANQTFLSIFCPWFLPHLLLVLSSALVCFTPLSSASCLPSSAHHAWTNTCVNQIFDQLVAPCLSSSQKIKQSHVILCAFSLSDRPCTCACVCLALSRSGLVEKCKSVMKGVLIGGPGACRIDLAGGWSFKAFLLAHWVNLLILINTS